MQLAVAEVYCRVWVKGFRMVQGKRCRVNLCSSINYGKLNVGMSDTFFMNRNLNVLDMNIELND